MTLFAQKREAMVAVQLDTASVYIGVCSIKYMIFNAVFGYSPYHMDYVVTVSNG